MAHRVPKRTSSLVRRSNILDGRPGFRIGSAWGHVSVLEGGGHICELVSRKHGAVNPLWKPTWRTIDPSTYTPANTTESMDRRLKAGCWQASLGTVLALTTLARPLQKRLLQATVPMVKLPSWIGVDSRDP